MFPVNIASREAIVSLFYTLRYVVYGVSTCLYVTYNTKPEQNQSDIGMCMNLSRNEVIFFRTTRNRRNVASQIDTHRTFLCSCSYFSVREIKTTVKARNRTHNRRDSGLGELVFNSHSHQPFQNISLVAASIIWLND